MDASPWLSIGEFARLSGVTIKALRLYAELGLLQPAAVKPHSRYRFYTRPQLSRLHRILFLKSASFTLAEIRYQLTTRDEALLEQVRARLVARAEEIQQQLACIDGEIRSSPHVVLKQVPKQVVWSRRQTIDSYDQADILLRELGRHVPASARLVSGAVWHDCWQHSGRIDCEVFWLSHGGSRVAGTAELGPATAASILHDGAESTIMASYEAGHRWLRDRGYRVAARIANSI